MTVRRTLPQKQRSFIGAWCFLDHYGPDDVTVTGGMNVPAHPHTGLQTVSWLFSGEIEHRDSAGFHAIVRPGELNLMTAGHGISHSERSTAATTVLHGAQLWVALPERARRTPKTFAHYVPPLVTGPGWQGQVFLGDLLGEHSPVMTHSALVGAELRLESGAELRFSVDPGYEHGVLVDAGEVAVSVACPPEGYDRGGMSGETPHFGGVRTGERASGAGLTGAGAETLTIPKDHLAYAALGAQSITLRAGVTGARVLVIGGAPLGEEIVMWWNFIGSSHEEIVQARADWQAQIAAVGVGDPSTDGLVATQPSAEGVDSGGAAAIRPEPSIEVNRYGLPAGEPEPPLPAPKLPLVKLKPRQ